MKGKIISISHRGEVIRDISEKRNGGLLNEEICRRYQSDLDLSRKQDFANAGSIIIVAAAHPSVKVIFRRDGQEMEAVIPPTYLHDSDIEAKALILDVLTPHGYRLWEAPLPVKALAVRSGLARYGKNNLAYIPGWGSFFRLRAFFTDIECADDSWQEFVALEECSKCQACTKACPAGAIREDRFLIYAERCLTFHNESESAFPEWIQRDWHHCLVGCMKCQRVCPQNRLVKDRTVWIGEFDEEETRILLEIPSHRYPQTLVAKLERLCLREYIPFLARNLNAVMGNRR